MKKNIDNLNEIIEWFNSGIKSSYIDSNFCNTRVDFNGRLSSYTNELSSKLDTSCLYLLMASLGEIGNNSFDHNLGQWQDEMGCVFIRNKNYAIVADRGQGIKSSLSKVYKLGPSEDSYLSVAFTKIITGRMPEKRGNGLKFVSSMLSRCNMSLICVSNNEILSINNFEFNEAINFNGMGTVTIVGW